MKLFGIKLTNYDNALIIAVFIHLLQNLIGAYWWTFEGSIIFYFIMRIVTERKGDTINGKTKRVKNIIPPQSSDREINLKL